MRAVTLYFQRECTRVTRYSCMWKGVVDDKPMTGELDQFGESVLEDLWNSIKTEFPVDDAPPDQTAVLRSCTPLFLSLQL